MLTSWLNPTRLKVYPRLIAGTMGVILFFNAVLGRGWKGATGQIIGSDFISLYSSGVILRQEPSSLYDFETQAKVQEALIAPAQTWGVNPFTNPPYVAQVMSWLSKLPVSVAFILWLILSLATTALSAWLITRYMLPLGWSKTKLPAKQLFVVIISSLAFLEGFHMGQNHALTLLLFTAAVALSMRKHWLAAGMVAGLLLYKPHFALGFLIVWLVWQQWNALIGFSIVTSLWLGSFLMRYGWQLLGEYFAMGSFLLKAEFLPERSGSLGVTPYNLLVDILPESAWSGIVIFSLALLAASTLFMAYFAYKQRNLPENERFATYILAILFPLLVSPHILLHDLIILVPGLALWSNLWRAREFLNMVIAIYLGTFVLPLAAKLLGLSLLAIIPPSLVAILIYQIYRRSMPNSPELLV